MCGRYERRSHVAMTPGSLEAYAKERGVAHGSEKWMDRLPEDLKQQCLEGWKAGIRGTVMCEWLKSIGYEDASEAKVRNWCRDHA
jgi:hypothetical protein